MLLCTFVFERVSACVCVCVCVCVFVWVGGDRVYTYVCSCLDGCVGWGGG